MTLLSALPLSLTMGSGQCFSSGALQHPWVVVEMDAESHKGSPGRVIYLVTRQQTAQIEFPMLFMAPECKPVQMVVN